MLTSLSTSTGTGSARCTWPGTSYPSQPGMIGGLDRRPAGVLDGTGEPDADGGQVGEGSSTGAHQVVHRVDHPGQDGLRSVGDQQPGVDLPEDRPVEVGQGGPACVAPTSTPTTSLAVGLRANSAGGRPPVDRAPPKGATSPSCMRVSIRAVTVDRASPVDSASWARVQAFRRGGGRRGHRCAHLSQAHARLSTLDPRLLKVSRQKQVTHATVVPCPRLPTSSNDLSSSPRG